MARPARAYCRRIKPSEINPAHWQVGGEVKLTQAVEGVPKGAKAKLTGFPKGYAVTVPAYTEFTDEQGGTPEHLQRPIEGFVAPSRVLADYDYARQQVRAREGTRVRVSEGETERTIVLIGPHELAAGSKGPGKTDPGRNALLTVHSENTPVALRVEAQNLAGEDGQPPVRVAAGDIEVKASNVAYTKMALTSDAYLQLFTMHASIMIFFVIIPMLVGGFGNFVVPLMIGAKDVAFPKLNMLSFWLAVPAGVIMLISFWTARGPA
ncbi:MAG: cbb3-type cytochrome c oxidase subunit I, partial [Dehalococcoidia bacterium]|nr:cbb3-type cytochrome c oxidase subunit I [Dehalococcoidia bacterium]